MFHNSIIFGSCVIHILYTGCAKIKKKYFRLQKVKIAYPENPLLIIKFVIPVVFIILLDWSVHTCLKQLYDGRDMCRVYHIKNNYMFRPFSLAIVRLRNEKNLVSSYTRVMWVVYIGEVRGEVGTRSRTCCLGWVVWVQGFWYYMPCRS